VPSVDAARVQAKRPVLGTPLSLLPGYPSISYLNPINNSKARKAANVVCTRELLTIVDATVRDIEPCRVSSSSIWHLTDSLFALRWALG
jgi:hypothetical protein